MFVGHIITAAVAPTVNDDSSKGMQQGYCWYDSVGLVFYICADPGTTGNAVWVAMATDTAGTSSAISIGGTNATAVNLGRATKPVTMVGDLQDLFSAAAASGAITQKAGIVYITKGTAAALTIGNPTATTDDGKTLTLPSATIFVEPVTIMV